ncbi:lymphocyte cytosolic protein 2-like isoform X2 [Pecten maximus]|uniref:lymphocyte cytosolic protein 2-like isoform X2 n=1 Tax=Pecten maximus TaxID=6579 RepID=UPI00145862AD|nr:lymphocyte cytosolic protein 2-like isoform X2 [Pecten maximus]
MSGTLPDYSGLVRWTINDVGQWLSSNAFPEFCRSFREAGIDGVKFVELDETELNRLRTPMNKRSKLMTIIKSIKKPDLSGSGKIRRLLRHKSVRVADFMSQKSVKITGFVSESFTRVQNIIRPPVSPHVPMRDYNQKTAPPIDSDSGSGSDDDYEWADSDFEDEHDDGGRGHGSHHRNGHTGQTQEDSDSSPDDDYENTKEPIAPPVPGREAAKEKFSVANLKTALIDFKQSSIRQKGRPDNQDGPDEDYDQPDVKKLPPASRPGRTAPQVSSQPTLPSRPGRRGPQAPPPEIEQPTYEETDDAEPPLPSRPGRRAQPAPPVEQPPLSRPGRRAQPVPPPQDEQPGYEETDIHDLAPEDVYEDPDNPTSQPPPPPRAGKRVMPPPPSQNTRRPPVNEPEEFYEVPSDLPEAPKPPIDDQPTYEELGEEEQTNKSSHKTKTPPARPQGKNKQTKSVALPPRGRLATPDDDSDGEDYEKPNQPTAPIPSRFQSRPKAGRVSSPVEDQPGYMDMQNNDSQGLIEDDIYVIPDEENEKKKPSKAAAPPPVNRSLPKTPANSATQFRLPARQQEPPPVPKSNKKEHKKEPAVEKTPSRGLPPPPKGGARPLPTVPPVNDQSEDEDDLEEDLNSYDWYRGTMTRQEGDMKLKQNCQNGMFAIRDSSKKKEDGDPRPYTLMIFNDNKVYNLPIRKRRKDGHYAMGNPKPKEEAFPKLADLVAFFSKRMIVLAGSGQTHLKMPIP